MILPHLGDPNFGHNLTKLGKIPAPISSKLDDLVPKLVKLGQMLPRSAQLRSKSTPNSAQIWSKSARFRSKFVTRGPSWAETWPSVARIWSILVKFGRSGAGQNRSNIGRDRPNWVRILSKLARIGFDLGKRFSRTRFKIVRRWLKFGGPGVNFGQFRAQFR